MEELVHHFDLVLWYFARWGDPVAVNAVGSAHAGDPALAETVTATVRFADGRYAAVTQTLAGFEYHLGCQVIGDAGALRAWWSGGMDRTREANYGLAVRRRGTDVPERQPLETSGELFELEEQLRRTVGAFRERRALVSAEAAKNAVAICLAVEEALATGRDVSLTPR
jgi:myo-inositol 2-dehydrogenase/D-chiro-inositol 1-dehydrogenase